MPTGLRNIAADHVNKLLKVSYVEYQVWSYRQAF